MLVGSALHITVSAHTPLTQYYNDFESVNHGTVDGDNKVDHSTVADAVCAVCFAETFDSHSFVSSKQYEDDGIPFSCHPAAFCGPAWSPTIVPEEVPDGRLPLLAKIY